MKKPFKFKQFDIYQDRCAMKVGTDGVLLGAWTSVSADPTSILDIGAGTGLLALMLAQRTYAETIEAIEIDVDAFEQCVENFEGSPWADRLFCYHAGLDEFVDEVEDRYDIIVSNPPFYAEEVGSGNASRDVARQMQSLPLEELVEAVSNLLSPEGKFSTIIPYKETTRFIELAAQCKLFPNRITRVKGNSTSEFKRSLVECSFSKSEIVEDELIIEHQRHKYTEEYVELTKEFYLKM